MAYLHLEYRSATRKYINYPTLGSPLRPSITYAITKGSLCGITLSSAMLAALGLLMAAFAVTDALDRAPLHKILKDTKKYVVRPVQVTA